MIRRNIADLTLKKHARTVTTKKFENLKISTALEATQAR